MNYVLESWDGESHQVFDNAAPPYDSYVYESDAHGKIPKEDRIKNFRDEDIDP
jgi:hypothetical protein